MREKNSPTIHALVVSLKLGSLYTGSGQDYILGRELGQRRVNVRCEKRCEMSGETGGILRKANAFLLFGCKLGFYGHAR